jgi:phenylacetate-CoA ligase
MSAAIAFVDRLKRHVVGESLVRRNPFYYDRSRRLLERLENQGFDERLAWSRAQLARTLQAASGTEYGRAVRAGTDIASWPFLAKEQLRGRLSAFTTGSDWFAVSAATGGTSGVPLKLVRTLDSIAFEQVCMDRTVEKLGVRPRDARMAILRGDHVLHPRALVDLNGLSSHAGRWRIFTASALKPDTVDRIADALEEFKPEMLVAYASALETLCRLLKERGRTLRIPTVLTSSEVLATTGWALAQEVLGARVLDQYGQAERIAWADTLEPHMFRFLHGYSYVEFLPYTGQVLPPNDAERIYEIVGTSFWNSLMPLVRYRTGDLIRLPATWGARELEELSLGLRTFSGVLGREQEIIACPAGVRLTGFAALPQQAPHVLRVQVVQEALDEVRILVLPTAGYCEQDAAILLANARTRIPAEVRVRVEVANWLERTPRGKTPLVVHRPPVHEALRRAGVEPMRTS